MLKKIILFTISFIITIFCLELYLRFTGISLPSYVFDNKKIGRTHNPNHDIFLIGAEGFCIDKVNELGYVGTAYPKKSNKGTIRITLLGSSYVEGLQVFLRNRFSYILEKELSKKLHRKVEVLNFAIGGDDIRGMYIRYIELVRQYNPDFTLFMVKPSDFSRKKSIPSPELIMEDKTVKVSYDFLNSSESTIRKKFNLLRKFGLGNFLKEAYEVYYLGRLPRILLDKLNFINTDEKSSNILGDTYSYFDLNKFVFDELNRENNVSKNKNIIVDIDGFQEGYKNYIAQLEMKNIDIFNELNKYDPKDLKFWKASRKMGHWNNFAHKVVGHLLAEKMGLSHQRQLYPL